jgi:hypothetical protein
MICNSERHIDELKVGAMIVRAEKQLPLLTFRLRHNVPPGSENNSIQANTKLILLSSVIKTASLV